MGVDGDISIHALRKESDSVRLSTRVAISISIHALRKESDRRTGWIHGKLWISIHALRKESDFRRTCVNIACCDFNPRSP